MLLLSLIFACGPKKLKNTVEESEVQGIVEKEEQNFDSDNEINMRISLLDSGQEPLRQMVYTAVPKKDSQYKMTVATNLLVSSEKEEELQAFTLSILINNRILDVQKNGGFTTQASFAQFSLQSNNALVTDALQESVASLTGLMVTEEYSAQGALLNQRFEAPENIPTSIVELVQSSFASLTSTSIAFPSEPIGIGAQWKIETKNNTQGLQTQQAILCTLVEQNDQQGRIEAIVGQELTGGASTNGIENFVSNGSLIYQFDLTEPGPSNFRMGMDSSYIVSKEEVIQSFKLNINIEGETLE